jgi:hypothetical protein
MSKKTTIGKTKRDPTDARTTATGNAKTAADNAKTTTNITAETQSDTDTPESTVRRYTFNALRLEDETAKSKIINEAFKNRGSVPRVSERTTLTPSARMRTLVLRDMSTRHEIASDQKLSHMQKTGQLVSRRQVLSVINTGIFIMQGKTTAMCSGLPRTPRFHQRMLL